MRYSRIAVLISLPFLFSCSSSSQQAESAASTGQEAPAEETPVEDQAAEVIDVVIEANDLMQFNLKEIQVSEGQRVRLTLKHVGSMSAEAMGHNWVLLSPGTDKADFGMAAITAKDTDYIPADMKDKVIANTKILGGGEETTIEFDAPAMGYYDFICSFPGHYGVMQGTLIVNPS